MKTVLFFIHFVFQLVVYISWNLVIWQSSHVSYFCYFNPKISLKELCNEGAVSNIMRNAYTNINICIYDNRV